MRLFDFFYSKRETDFDNLVQEHEVAIEKFMSNKIEVYSDMTGIDKGIITDCISLRKDEQLPEREWLSSLSSLPSSSKKFIIKNIDHICKANEVFQEYNSKKKRAILLCKRFSVNNVFDSVFAGYLGYNYEIKDLNSEQYNCIVGNYPLLVERAAEIAKVKAARQLELKNKLYEKVGKKRIQQLINKQSHSCVPVNITGINSDIASSIKEMSNTFIKMYAHNGINESVIEFLQDKYNVDEGTVHEALVILANKSEFYKEEAFYNKLKNIVVSDSLLLKYLSKNGREKDHEGILYCDETFVTLQLYINTDKQRQDTMSWLQRQTNFSKYSAQSAANFPNIKVLINRMYIDTMDENGLDTKKVLNFTHAVFKEFTYENLTFQIPSASQYIFSNGLLAVKYFNNELYMSNDNQKETFEILEYVVYLYSKMESNLAVILNTSKQESNGVDERLQFNYLAMLLQQHRIPLYNLNEIKKIDAPKSLVVVEAVSEVQEFRETCRLITRTFPGVLFSYVSLYNELTKKRYDCLINSNK